MKFKTRLKKQEQLSDYISAIAWSPQYETLASCSAVGELTLLSPQSDCIYLHQAGETALNDLEFSAQGRFLATAGQAGKLEVWNLQEESPTLIFAKNYASAWIDTLSWHPQKMLLAYAVGREVYILDSEQQRICYTFPFKSSSILDLAWHPQKDYLAVSGNSGVKVWDLQHPHQAPEKIDVPGASVAVAWSGDGRYLASGNLDRTLTLLEWENPPPWLMQGFPGKVRKVAWSNCPDLKSPLLAAACVDGVILWWQEKEQWQNLVLEHHQGFVKDLSFHPSQRLLASGGNDGIIFLWEGKATTPVTSIKSPSGGFSCMQWHDQGNYLAAGTSQGNLLIWELVHQSKQGFG